MQKNFFEALSSGKTEEAADMMVKRLAKDFPTSELLGNTYLIQQDLREKLARAESEEERQRIRNHYAAKILDIWEQLEKQPIHQSLPERHRRTDGLVKVLIVLLAAALLLILIEIITW